MEALHITKQQARRFLLAHQYLWPPFGLQGKAGILKYFQRVRCVQFDPLNITGQNAELVLQARVADFKPAMLRELLYEERALLDGWEKNMSIYPTEDWPYFQRFRDRIWHSPDRSNGKVREIIPQIRQAFEERGPMSSLDLDYGQTVDWWWAPTRLARAALDIMYLAGELVVHHKINTRKVYDLAHRHLPAELLEAPDPHPEDDAYHEWYIERRTGSIGLLWNRSGDGWLGIRLKAPERLSAIQRLVEQGRMQEVQVEGIRWPLYMRSQDLPLLEECLRNKDLPHQAVLVAPLDNLLWERRLVHDLFGFHYRWEVYTPVDQRQYGYYVLPVLYGDRFVARCEPVFQKKKHILTIQNWWWEEGVEPDPVLLDAVYQSVERFSRFLGAKELIIENGLGERK